MYNVMTFQQVHTQLKIVCLDLNEKSVFLTLNQYIYLLSVSIGTMKSAIFFY
jgi:hypothetical protein